MGLLNDSGSEPVEAPEKTTPINGRECSKKFIQKDHSPFDARSVRSVSERSRHEERQGRELEGPEKWGEHRWRLFSTVPEKMLQNPGADKKSPEPSHSVSQAGRQTTY